MKLFDQYVVAMKETFSDPSPALAAYIHVLETVDPLNDAPDIDADFAARQARWEALTEDDRIACQAIVATL